MNVSVSLTQSLNVTTMGSSSEFALIRKNDDFSMDFLFYIGICLICTDLFASYIVIASFRRFVVLASKTQFLKVRYPSLIEQINIIGILILLLEQPFWIIVSICEIIFIADWILEIWYAIWWFLLFGFLNLKSWSLFFKQRFNLALIDESWVKEINVGATGMYHIII